MFKSKRVKENKMKLELILKSMRIPYEKKNGYFILKHNKYVNNGSSYSNLIVEYNEEGISFKDPGKREIKKIPAVVDMNEAADQILNIFGVVSRKALVRNM